MKKLSQHVKNKFYVLLILGFLLLGYSSAQAKTLQELAQVSNALLHLANKAPAEGSGTADSCGLSMKQISKKSQKLQFQIDGRISQLNDEDFKIINGRYSQCDQDCTCDIYALAFEKKNKKDELKFAEKASLTLPEQREKCFKNLPNFCESKFLKGL